MEMSRRLDYAKGIASGLYHMGFGQYLSWDHDPAMALLLEAEQIMKTLQEENGLWLVNEEFPAALENRKFAQALEILERDQKVTREAAARIGLIVQSLKGLVRLDSSAVESADLNQGLNGT